MPGYDSGYGQGYGSTAWERYSISRTSRGHNREDRDGQRSRTSGWRPREYDEISYDRRSRSSYHSRYDESPVRNYTDNHSYRDDRNRDGGSTRSRYSNDFHNYESTTSPARSPRAYRTYEIEKPNLQAEPGDFSKFLLDEIEKTRRDNKFLSREITQVKSANLQYENEYVGPPAAHQPYSSTTPKSSQNWGSPQNWGTPFEVRRGVPVPHRQSFGSGEGSSYNRNIEIRSPTSPASCDVCTDTATLEKEAGYLKQLEEDKDLMCVDEDPTSCSTVSTDDAAEAAIRETLLQQEETREHHLTRVKMQSRAVTLLTSLIRSINQRSGEMAVCPVDGKQVHKYDYNNHLTQITGTPTKDLLEFSAHSDPFEVFSHNYEALRMYAKHR